MNNVDLYKQFYFKELATKTELNNAVNIPIVILSGLITIHIYLFSNATGDSLSWITCVSATNAPVVVFSLVFLILSYGNPFKGQAYAELSDMSSILDYQKKLEEKKKEGDFDKYLQEQYAKTSSLNFKLNQSRFKFLSYAKRCLILSVFLTLISCTLFIISLIN